MPDTPTTSTTSRRPIWSDSEQMWYHKCDGESCAQCLARRVAFDNLILNKLSSTPRSVGTKTIPRPRGILRAATSVSTQKKPTLKAGKTATVAFARRNSESKSDVDDYSSGAGEEKEPFLKNPPSLLKDWEIFIDNEAATWDDWIDATEWSLKDSNPEGDYTLYACAKGPGGIPAFKLTQTIKTTGPVLDCYEWLITSGEVDRKEKLCTVYKVVESSQDRALKMKVIQLHWPISNRMTYAANKTVKTDKEFNAVSHSWPCQEEIPSGTIEMFMRGRHLVKKISEDVYQYEWTMQMDTKGFIPSKIIMFASRLITAGFRNSRKLMLETGADLEKLKLRVRQHGMIPIKH